MLVVCICLCYVDMCFHVSSFLSFHLAFYHESVLNFVKRFLIMRDLSLALCMCYVSFIDLHMLDYLYIL